MEKIIKKKLLLIVSLLAVTFALAGCNSSDKKVAFDYDPEELVYMAQTQAEQLISITQMEEVYNFYTDSDANGGQIDETVSDGLKVFSTLENDYGKFISFKSNYKFEEIDDKVVVSIYANCADSEAIIKCTFVDNSVQYDYFKFSYENQLGQSGDELEEALHQNGMYPYKISEFEVAANQTMKDKMKSAGANTVIGMGIVFVTLIFISFIISLLKFVPILFDKETIEKRKAEKAKAEAKAKTASDAVKEEESKAAPASGIVDIVNTATGESVMDDSELVAVISAAVMAAQGGQTRVRVNYPSNDKLVVRPRRRNKR